APTPTGAAELVAPSQIELKEKVHHIKQTLNRTLHHLISQKQQRLSRLQQSYAFRYLDRSIVEKEQQLDQTTDQLSKSLAHFLNNNKKDFSHLYRRFMIQHPETQIEFVTKSLRTLTNDLHKIFYQIVADKEQRLTAMVEKLTLLNPVQTLQRGFATPYT